MISQIEFIQAMTQHLTDAGIDYMVSGSFAANIYGEQRSTLDTDIVIELRRADLFRLIKAVEADYYVSRAAAQEALANRSMFNIIDTTSGWKADLIIRKDRPFSIEEFSRRRRIEYAGKPLWIVSAEDAVLSKLEWAKKGDSDRQVRDAASIVMVQWGRLDLDYLRKWAQELDVADSLEPIIEAAERQNAGGDA